MYFCSVAFYNYFVSIEKWISVIDAVELDLEQWSRSVSTITNRKILLYMKSALTLKKLFIFRFCILSINLRSYKSGTNTKMSRVMHVLF